MSSNAKLIPRPYQLDAAAVAIANNTIINVCTGGGKTLIAVIVIDHFLQSSNKAVCFLVPSRALVTQQAGYLQKNCRSRCGKELCIAGKILMRKTASYDSKWRYFFFQLKLLLF